MSEIFATATLRPDIIQSRINNFWGYGSLEAPVWFVGMEEGFDTNADVSQLRARFEAADGRHTVDIRRGMEGATDHMRWFHPNAPVQSTWKFPIALFLYLTRRQIPTLDEIRAYQIGRLGDVSLKETACIELMPLPSNKANASTWLYSSVGISSLVSRNEYLKTYKPERMRKLAALVREYRPSLVIFYSLTYLDDWKTIIGVEPACLTKGMYAVESNGTLFCIIPQSVSFGMSYQRLYAFADLLGKQEVFFPKKNV